MHKILVFTTVMGILLAGFSCSKFRKIEKSPDWRVKYEAALAYFNQKDYYKAAVLFEQIKPIIRGLPEGEKVDFYLAYCEYHQKNYLLSAEYFKNFYETYGRSNYAEEARFMHAYSLYASTPNYNLDQTESVTAMTAMQEFLNRYPSSKYKDQAINVIVTTQSKLEHKGFDNAKQYYKLRSYKAAVVALNNFQDNFPDSKYIEEAKYLIVVCHYELAQKSIQSKKPERYQEVVNSYKELVDDYPNSKFLKDAEKIYSESLEQINQLKNINS